MNDDRIEGTGKIVEGKIQSAFGKVTGDSTSEIKGAAKSVIGGIQDNCGKLQDYAHDSVEAVEKHITDKPVQSALIALGIGFLLGKLSGL